MLTVSATEIQNNFGKYLKLVQSNEEIRITKNGEEVARMISREAVSTSLSASLRGILKNDYDDKKMRDERIKRREGID